MCLAMVADDPRARLLALATERDESLAALSAMLGRNPAYLQQYVRRGSPRVLAERDRRLLADYFGIGETELGGLPQRGMTLRIPRLDVAASAGPGAHVDAEIVIGSDAIDAALARELGLREGAAGVIRVRGDSMAPGLADGDHIIVDTARRLPDARGGVFVVRIGGALMVKRVARRGGMLTVSSDNPDALPVPAGRVDVVGRVVWQMRSVR